MTHGTCQKDEDFLPISVPQATTKEQITNPSMEELITATRVYAEQYMSHYDASHDFSHILRVLKLALYIADIEESTFNDNTTPDQSSTTTSSPPRYSRDIITLASLLHDVGDSKYLPAHSTSGTSLALDFLISAGACPALAHYIQTIVNHVSYSAEIKDPSLVTAVLVTHPELAVVQDADRLDAMGAIGVARALTYAANRVGKGSIEQAVGVMKEQLLPRERWMKTREGRRLARVRAERIVVFREWYLEETGQQKLRADE